MCGKDSDVFSSNGEGIGSPPHVRERRIFKYLNHDLTGITPACAGKTISRLTDSMACWDHPRMCGKDPDGISQGMGRRGSPPHVRERLPIPMIKHSYFRITPACAGKTITVSVKTSYRKDHPRMCGKDSAKAGVFKQYVGSPPHVRERR